MAGKIRHFLERDGRYFARIVIPKRLRPFLENKTELREVLGPDRRMALQKLSAAVAKFQDQLGRARLQADASDAMPAAITSVVQRPLSDQQLALRHYHRRLEQDAAARQAHPMWALTSINDLYTAELRKGLSGQLYDDELDRLVGELVSEFRQNGHTTWVKGDAGWRGLAMNLCAAEYEALERACEKDEGDFSGVPVHPVLVRAIEEAGTEAKSVSSVKDELAPEVKSKEPVSLQGLFDRYFVAQKKLGIGREAERRWKSSFKHLINFLGHDDAARLTKKDVMRWRDNRLLDVLPKTVADVDLAGLRAILKWAVEEDYLETSVASSVRQKVQRRVLSREKGYTDDEAINVLRFSLDYSPAQTGNSRTTETAKTTSAKRWIPLICALTGARVTEISQLRTQDFRLEDGVHVFRITPDAGSVKTGEYRDVPIHRQLLDRGLWDYAKSCDGPLFYANTLGRDKLNAARMVSGRVSGWLTKSGMVPAEVDPNHGWRHRFTTVAREAGVSDRVIDAIAGHAGRTAGERYGDVTIKTRKDAIDRIPDYVVVSSSDSLLKGAVEDQV